MLWPTLHITIMLRYWLIWPSVMEIYFSTILLLYVSTPALGGLIKVRFLICNLVLPNSTIHSLTFKFTQKTLCSWDDLSDCCSQCCNLLSTLHMFPRAVLCLPCASFDYKVHIFYNKTFYVLRNPVFHCFMREKK